MEVALAYNLAHADWSVGDLAILEVMVSCSAKFA